ncbi:MAG: hypothetical protein DRH12_10415 [Deltaproteobacteria bacterium]|nr:MAG: hypothetical protein DRH12_10415 [Deltaproteobacteria bacterium]
MWRRKKIGLALGGGGARGMAHIGVLRVLEREGIPIDLIVGTSIGALVGACYACGLDSFDLERRVEEFLSSPDFQNSALKSIRELQRSKKLTFTQKIQAFFKNQFILTYAMFRAGILQYEDFQAMVDFFVPDVRVEHCDPPFRAVATDIASGQAVVFNEGPLRKAVMASCAVPAAVPPVEFDGRLLCDGGIVHLVPTPVARDEGADFVIAVSVNPAIESLEQFCSAMDIYVRSTEIMCYHLERCRLERADVVIHPEVGDLHWTDFTLAKDLLAIGMAATEEKLKEIRKALPLLRRFFPKGRGGGDEDRNAEKAT